MKKKALLAVVILLSALPAFGQKKENERLDEAATVMKEILAMPEGIPQDLLNKAECVVIYPSVKKAAFIVGASYGRGMITCRSGKEFTGPWSAPAMFSGGGSFGLQISGQAADFVLLVMMNRARIR